ncbi:MAG: hypothetical protein WCA36_13530 [Pseudolabrys sp.]|jgi:uncharacterized membrane protein YuzA (DUF378 family)
MRNHIQDSGFRAPTDRALGRERRTVAFAELVAGIALALSIVVLATVVSVGVARADVVEGVVGHEGSLFGIALLLGLLFIGLGGVAALSDQKHRERRHH